MLGNEFYWRNQHNVLRVYLIHLIDLKRKAEAKPKFGLHLVRKVIFLLCKQNIFLWKRIYIYTSIFEPVHKQMENSA